MRPLILDPSHFGGALLTVLARTAGESSVWTAVGNHPLALAGLLLAVYGLLGALRRKLSDGVQEPLPAARTDR